MNAFAIAAITFVSTFGFAWLGTVINSKLPPSHVGKESQDVVRLGMGLVATLTALLLGLVTAAAKGSFDTQGAALRSGAVNILTLDRHLARYGPETGPTREMLRGALAARIDAMSPAQGPPSSSLFSTDSIPPAELIQNQILALAPQTEAQRWLKAEALKLTDEVVKTRWLILGSASGAVPGTFLMVVIFWLTATFASFGLFAPRNGTVLAVLLIAAVSVAAAMFLILELDGPLTGAIRVSVDPLRFALANIGK